MSVSIAIKYKDCNVDNTQEFFLKDSYNNPIEPLGSEETGKKYEQFTNWNYAKRNSQWQIFNLQHQLGCR